MEFLKAEKKYITVQSHRYSSDRDLQLFSFSAQCKIFFLKQCHEANELKICRIQFCFLGFASNNFELSDWVN